MYWAPLYKVIIFSDNYWLILHVDIQHAELTVYMCSGVAAGWGTIVSG